MYEDSVSWKVKTCLATKCVAEFRAALNSDGRRAQARSAKCSARRGARAELKLRALRKEATGRPYCGVFHADSMPCCQPCARPSCLNGGQQQEPFAEWDIAVFLPITCYSHIPCIVSTISESIATSLTMSAARIVLDWAICAV